MSDQHAESDRAYRETLLSLWGTYCRAGLAAENDEMRRFVVEGMTECLGKLLLIDGSPGGTDE